MKPLRLALAVVLAGGSLAHEAAASVLCRTGRRAVVERTECRPRETLIPLAVVGPEGAPGSPGQAGARGRGAATIVDATGTPVGPVFHVAEAPALYTRPEEPAAFALLDRQAVGGATALGIVHDGRGAGTVYYAEAGCAGAPLVTIGGFLRQLQVVQEAVFYPTTPSAQTVTRSHEVANSSGPCAAVTPRGGCCIAFEHRVPPGTFAVAGRTTLQALGLRAPFSARAE